MNVHRTIIPLSIEGFSTGKIARWKDFVFLFDAANPAAVQLDSDYNVVGRLPLKEIKKIDSVLFNRDSLIIADSLGHKIHCLGITGVPGAPVTLSGYAGYPLPVNAVLVAALSAADRYLFLDKNTCMIRVYDSDFKEIKTAGSRMGYVQLYEDEESQRLGFEFPEDMAAAGDRMVVSDSGNKRLVVIDGEFKQEKVFKLPEFPYKIVFCDEDRVVVSDFDRSLMAVSLEYGFIAMEESDYAVDFFQSFRDGRRSLVGSEHGNELAALEMPGISVESLAEEAGNSRVLMRVKIDAGQLEEARGIALSDEALLPEYAKHTPDDALESELTGYVEKTVNTVIEKIEPLKEEISTSSLEFVKTYRAIPGSEDREAAHIDKENIRHRMFLKLKEYRSLLKTVNVLRNDIHMHPGPLAVCNRLLDTRFRDIEQGIRENLARIESNLSNFNEAALLEAVVRYWLFAEEEGVLFREAGLVYEKLFGDLFLLALLDDFYYHVAELFLKRGKVDEYISFADRELTMYSDKMNIFKQFVHRLLRLKRYDDVLRMLDKFPDKNREDVNYFYYRVYLARSDREAAFRHLKKELDRYPHKVELIPRLIQMKMLAREEVETYINKMLEKSGQSIDMYLNAAAAFHAAGEAEKANLYIDKELRHFPENQDAAAFKLKLLLDNPDREEMKKWVTRLTSHRFSLLRSRVYFVLEEYEESWGHFKKFMEMNSDRAAAEANVDLMMSLNYIPLKEPEVDRLMELTNRVMFDVYKKEIRVYLSFLKHVGKIEMSIDVETFDNEDYLSAYSTSVMAYGHFVEQLKGLAEGQKWDEMLPLAESILKYNPGDENIFEMIDRVVG